MVFKKLFIEEFYFNPGRVTDSMRSMGSIMSVMLSSISISVNVFLCD
jgi:hypothetical protein